MNHHNGSQTGADPHFPKSLCSVSFFLLCLFAFVLTVRSEVCVMAAMGDCVKMPQTKKCTGNCKFSFLSS